MSWCKCHILSSRGSDAGPWWGAADGTHMWLTKAIYTEVESCLHAQQLAAAVHTHGSQDRPFSRFTHSHPGEESVFLSFLTIHITRSSTPSLLHSAEGHRAVIDAVQNAATWYAAERESIAQSPRS